jgi:acyl-CoA thioester hydrolase
MLRAVPTAEPDEPRVSPIFVQELVAAPADIDELAHVSNVAYVRWIQDIAKAHSEAVGWDHAAYLALGAVFVVRRHEIEYLAQAFEGERVRLETYIASFTAASSVRRTRIVRTSDGREVARASTLWALVSIGSGRPTRIPDTVKAAFLGPASGGA